jgi:hypothetical protein
MSNLFHSLEIEAFRKGLTLRTKESQDWFRRKAAAMGKVDRNALMKEEPVQLRNRQGVGNMYMFFYDPKHKKTLPYYDAFPLVIVIGPAEGGFLGLNLHYLPLALRAKFLDGLMDITNNKRYDETTKFGLSYEMLQKASKMKYFKPCIKHYLKSHVRSRFALVEAPEWEIATFLPTADFQKASATQVYKDSRKKING